MLSHASPLLAHASLGNSPPSVSAPPPPPYSSVYAGFRVDTPWFSMPLSEYEVCGVCARSPRAAVRGFRHDSEDVGDGLILRLSHSSDEEEGDAPPRSVLSKYPSALSGRCVSACSLLLCGCLSPFLPLCVCVYVCLTPAAAGVAWRPHPARGLRRRGRKGTRSCWRCGVTGPLHHQHGSPTPLYATARWGARNRIR